jgi:hypothetical protein
MGDNNNVVIIIRPSNDRIEINNNSSLVYINENAVRLSNPVIFQINEYLLPVELVETYLNGISVSYDNKNHICTMLRSTESDVSVTANIIQPNGLDKCSIPPENTSSAASSDTGSSANSGKNTSSKSTSSNKATSGSGSKNTSSNKSIMSH